MSEATTLSAVLKSIDEGPAWHGPALRALLDDVTAEQALARPIPGAHSIWELTLHMNAWLQYTVDVLGGSEGAFTNSHRDWPPVPAKADPAAWEKARREIGGVIQQARELIVHCDEARLRETVPGRDFPLKVLLHGVVHHTLYHMGQIALIKRALAG
jgi:hypothetical protein